MRTMQELQDALRCLRRDCQDKEDNAHDAADETDNPEDSKIAEAWEKLTGMLLDAESVMARLQQAAD